MDSFPFAMLDRTIVGVAGDVRFRGLERDSEPQVYLAYKQVPDGSAIFYAPKELVIGTSSNSTALVPAVRSIIRKTDPELPIAAVRPLREVVDLQTAPRTTQIRLVATFAALALILAGIGIHGLLSFAVGQRSPEFGLRIALGAQSRDILSMVFREGLLLALIGTTLGLILSFYAGRWMQGLLAGIAPSDPATLIVSGIVALTMTLSGSLLPALLPSALTPARSSAASNPLTKLRRVRHWSRAGAGSERLILFLDSSSARSGRCALRRFDAKSTVPDQFPEYPDRRFEFGERVRKRKACLRRGSRRLHPKSRSWFPHVLT